VVPAEVARSPVIRDPPDRRQPMARLATAEPGRSQEPEVIAAKLLLPAPSSSWNSPTVAPEPLSDPNKNGLSGVRPTPDSLMRFDTARQDPAGLNRL
jgi:hypothetical protein